MSLIMQYAEWRNVEGVALTYVPYHEHVWLAIGKHEALLAALWHPTYPFTVSWFASLSLQPWCCVWSSGLWSLFRVSVLFEALSCWIALNLEVFLNSLWDALLQDGQVQWVLEIQKSCQQAGSTYPDDEGWRCCGTWGFLEHFGWCFCFLAWRIWRGYQLFCASAVQRRVSWPKMCRLGATGLRDTKFLTRSMYKLQCKPATWRSFAHSGAHWIVIIAIYYTKVHHGTSAPELYCFWSYDFRY